jgi:predicted dehydrogenase
MKRIIQVGVGGMGAEWTRCVAESKQWKAVAYVDINEETLYEAAKKYGIPKKHCFTSLDDAMDAAEADALLDVAPQQFRKEICRKAIERGLDVLAEKPMADSIENAKTIEACAQKHGRILMIAQNYRYQPAAQTARELVRQGALGNVGYVGVSFHKGPRFGGYRETMPYPLLLDMSIHHFDLMRAILDSDIHSIEAVGIHAPWSWYKGDATAMAMIEMENGVAVNYFASWVSTGIDTSWNGTWRIEGSDASLTWENEDLFLGTPPDKKEPVKPVAMTCAHQARLLELFREALDTRIEPETSGRRNLNSLAATYTAVRSAQERRRVTVREMLG